MYAGYLPLYATLIGIRGPWARIRCSALLHARAHVHYRISLAVHDARCTCSFRVSRAQKPRARASSRSRMLGMRSPRSATDRDGPRGKEIHSVSFRDGTHSRNPLVISLERTAEDSPDTDRDRTRINYAARFIGQRTVTRPARAESRYFHEVPSA